MCYLSHTSTHNMLSVPDAFSDSTGRLIDHVVLAIQVKPAYLVLDAFHHGQVESHMSVTKIMADSEYLRECQDLFELYVSDYIMLTRCKVRLHPGYGVASICHVATAGIPSFQVLHCALPAACFNAAAACNDFWLLRSAD